MNKTLMFAAAGLALGLSGHAFAAGDAAAGQAKSAMCAACHGADGNSAAPEWPKLAGQHAGYLVKQLQEFKSGARVNAVMSGMVAALSDQDMQDIAAYFASQKGNAGAAAPELAKAGEQLYRGGNLSTGVAACQACHTATGSGNPEARFPALSGQHAAYAEAQLRAFRSGERANDPNGMMRGVARSMTDAEIKAVAAYLQGLN